MEAFSKRHEFAPKPGALIYDDAPTELRRGLLCILALDLDLSPSWLRYIVCSTLRRLPDANRQAWAEVQDLLYNCNWYTVYDFCERIYSDWETHPLGALNMKNKRDKFEAKLNDLFKELGMGYEMRNGRLERRSTPFVDRQVLRARDVLLSDPRFAGPSQQFERAIEWLSLRPSPDAVNAMREAIGSLEGVARIVSGLHSETLGRIVDRYFRSRTDQAICSLIDKIYGYASNVGGIRHGQVAPLSVGAEEAELLLGFTASLIVYLSRKKWAQS